MKIKTLFLKMALIAIGIIVLFFCALVFPNVLIKVSYTYPKIVLTRYLFTGCLYLSAILFYIAEGYAYRILQLIDRDNVFSGQALHAIKQIKYAVGGMGVCYLLFLPMIYWVADVEDAPGMIIIMTVIAMIPFVVAVFAAILEKLLQKATQLKVESQYTV